MNKIIWTCWFQGREMAPHLVQRCIESWEARNPGWEVRCLDARTIGRYIVLDNHIDLAQQSITAASLSDILRILLLHEFGGVWVDATTFCNKPLDDWLPEVMAEGFFAFAAPATTRPIASWFLAAEVDHPLVIEWSRRTVDFWSGRESAQEYFWFHHLFRDLLTEDQDALRSWSAVPKMSARSAHALQTDDRMLRPKSEVISEIDWNFPVFKLTYRLPSNICADALLYHCIGDPPGSKPVPPNIAAGDAQPFASLKTATTNLGDHLQVIASLRLAHRLDLKPRYFIDRDDEIRSAPMLAAESEPVAIILNGWFKRNGGEWPPHPKLDPLFIGFHARARKCPSLLSDASLAYLGEFAPVGCRDLYTADLFQQRGIDTFVSNCLTLTFPKRIRRPQMQTRTFLVARDDAIVPVLEPWLPDYTFISHYSESDDFEANMSAAAALLDRYREEAGLIVTTLLHCALPAIAMGIPVIVFYPPHEGGGHQSDVERFSSLATMLPVNRLDALEDVDWAPQPVDVSCLKLSLLDQFFALAGKWRGVPGKSLGPIAPSARKAPA